MGSIYFAGPDVFRPDYDDRVRLVRRLGAKAGFEALLPGDDGPDDSLGIFNHNLDLIRRADGLIANLESFRGCSEPDSGTVFECGFAFGLGKFVIGIIADSRSLLDKLKDSGAEYDGPSGTYRHCGWGVEDFGLPLNLMVSHCLTATAASLPEAVALAQRRLSAAKN